MGYLGVQPAASLSFGIPRPLQTVFLIEQAMNNLIADAETKVRSILCILDNVETKLVEAQDYLVAQKLEDITLRDGHPDLLEREYQRWAKRLADILGCPLYPYSSRFSSGSNAVTNVRVR